MPFPLIGALVGGAASLGGALISARTARKAGEAQEAAAERNIGIANDYTDAGLRDLENTLNQAVTGVQGAADAANAGYGRGITALNQGYGQANQAAQQGYTQGISTLNQGYDQARGYQQPFYSQGTGALSEMSNLLGLGGTEAANEAISRFQTSPGYQFQMEQGVGALDRSAAARGGLYSGAQGKALTEYGQGLANQEYNNRISQLAGMAGMGQSAGNNLTSLAANQGQMGGQMAVNQGLTAADLAAQRGQGISSLNINQGLTAGGYQGALADLLLGGNSQRNAIRLTGLNAATGANQDIGAAQAGTAINVGNAWSNGLGNLTQMIGYGAGEGFSTPMIDRARSGVPMAP